MHKIQCKRCAVDYVRQSRRFRALDRVLSTIHMYVFRCQLCAHRFWVMQWDKPNHTESDDDKREFGRIAVQLPVIFVGDQKSGEGFITDLSIRGCSLQTETRPQHGAILSLTLQPAENLPPIHIETAIVKSALGKRLGLEFEEIDTGEEERLRGYIETLLVTDPDELRKTFSNL
jgi:hypothetical protein